MLKGGTKVVLGILKESLRIFCWEVSDISSADKLYKILAKDPRVGNGPLLLPYEEYILSEEEVLKLMLETHFLGSVEICKGNSLRAFVQFWGSRDQGQGSGWTGSVP
jgi:hypothetical protein